MQSKSKKRFRKVRMAQVRRRKSTGQVRRRKAQDKSDGGKAQDKSVGHIRIAVNKYR